MAYFPGKKEYFMQLAAVYSELGRQKEAFAVMAAAYDNKLNLNGSELIRLAQLYRMYEFPYEAGRILEKGLTDGSIKKTSKTWEELGNAWFQAREMEKAMQPLRIAAKSAKKGNIYTRLCQVHAQNDEWADVVDACTKALNKGDIGEAAGSTWLLLGIGHYENGHREKAVKSFDTCTGYEKMVEVCGKWRGHVKAEIARDLAEASRAAEAARIEREERREREEQLKQFERDVENL